MAEHHSHGYAHYAQPIGYKTRMHREYHATHYQTQPYHADARHNALYLLEIAIFA